MLRSHLTSAIVRSSRWPGLVGLALASAVAAASFGGEADEAAPPLRPRPLLYRRVPIPKPFLVTKAGVTFGGDLRIGDLDGDGRCDLLVYRCNHGAPKDASVFIYIPAPLDEHAYTGYRAGPRQYNPGLMD